MKKDPMQKRHEQSEKEVDASLKGFSAALAELLVEEESHKQNLLPKKLRQQQWQAEIDNEITDFEKKMENGASLIFKTLIELSKNRPELFSDEVADGIISFMKYSGNVQDHQSEYIKALEKGQSLQELCGMSNKVLEAFYQTGKYIYEHQRYAEAADVFSVLTIFNSEEPVFWLGLGNSEYFCNKYEPALVAYAMVALTNPNDPFCHLYSSKCYEAIKDFDNAINALDLAIFVMGDNKEYKKLKEAAGTEQKRLAQLK